MVPRQVSPVCCDSEKREGEAGRGDEKNERGRCVVEKGASVIRGETYREESAHLLIERGKESCRSKWAKSSVRNFSLIHFTSLSLDNGLVLLFSLRLDFYLIGLECSVPIRT